MIPYTGMTAFHKAKVMRPYIVPEEEDTIATNACIDEETRIALGLEKD